VFQVHLWIVSGGRFGHLQRTRWQLIYISHVSPVFLRVVTADIQRPQRLIDAWHTFEIDFDNFRHPHIWRGRICSPPSLKIHSTAEGNEPHGKHKALNTSLSKVTSERGQPVSFLRVSVITGFQKLTGNWSELFIFLWKLQWVHQNENPSWLAPELSNGTVRTGRPSLLSNFHKFVKGMTSGILQSILQFSYLLFFTYCTHRRVWEKYIGPTSVLFRVILSKFIFIYPIFVYFSTGCQCRRFWYWKSLANVWQCNCWFFVMRFSSPMISSEYRGCWYVISLTRKETGYSDRRFWVSYILFVIIIGGILVLFIYIYIYRV
jgi:hypothetical protein